MPLELVFSVLLFPVVIFGLAWPLASRLRVDGAEKLVATAALSLLGVYLFAFARYWLDLPPGAFWALPLLAAGGLLAGRSALAKMLGDRDVRALLLGQLLVSGWCLGWLSFVVSYSGGGWSGDWFEHWQRTWFFLGHWPLMTKFLKFYLLPARPPLANLVTGALLRATGVTFPAYQAVTTLLNSLAYLPAALLVRRFLPPGPAQTRGGARAAFALFAVLLMLNPSFLENATFAWTKLFAAFFVLGGLYFFLRAHDATPPPAAARLSAACLAAALLAHYSAGPYVVLLIAAWLGLNRRRWQEREFWRLTAVCGVIGGAILATWFGWSLAVYGPGPTLANPSGAGAEVPSGSHLGMVLRNLRDTIGPHFLRNVDPALITQSSPWGYCRDWFFQLYQVNLLFIFGSTGWIVLGRELVRGFRTCPAGRRWFWTGFCGGVFLLGVAVVGTRDRWGLAHICLQSLLLLGLAFVAARWTVLGRAWRWLLIAGLTFDFCLGVALQFGVEAFLPDRWLEPGRPMAETLASYTFITRVNAFGKTSGRLDFLGDVLSVPGALVLALLAGILTLAVVRAARRAD